MKKTLLASAVAAATFSGAVAAADMPTVYGNIQYALSYTDVENGAGDKFNGIEHADNGSTLGIKHSHEIAPGLTGFLKAEMEFDADEKGEGKGLTDLDEAYIGIQGDSFGKIWVGSDDSTYERAIDIIYNFHEIGSDIGGSYDTGEGDLIQYESPSFGGLKLGAAVQVNGDADGSEKSYPYQLAAIYGVDALEVAFAMDSNDGDDANAENTYGLRATYTMGDLSLTGEYQTRKDVADVFGIMGVYTLGANQFALSYQVNDDDDSGDKNDTLAVQALHNLSDNMYVYAEAYISNADSDVEYEVGGFTASGEERSTLALGAVYYF
jgi:predicted porin